MREILFRGLHRRKGEKVRLDGSPVENMWVFGGYCQYNEKRGIIYQTIPDIHKYPVYAETVGQFTGLIDKNGKRIFEGDIVEDTESGYTYIVKWFDEYGCFGLSNKNGAMEIEYIDIFIDSLQIVGNLFDDSDR